MAASGLPPGWAMAHAPNGTPYYYNSATQATTWEKPSVGAGLAPAPPVPAAAAPAAGYGSSNGYSSGYSSYGSHAGPSRPMGGGRPGPGGPARPESKAEKKARKNRPFVDITKIPDDPPHDDPQVNEWRSKNEIKCAGRVPPPYRAFEDFPGLSSAGSLWSAIKGAGFPTPSVIQAQAWPAAVSGRDVIGVAKTGSGKTLGFLVPAFVNILNQTWGYKDPRYGPVGLVLAPTRELATQIEEECVKFGRSSGVYSTCCFGGAPKGQQLRALRNGVAIVTATPGRLNDFLEARQVTLQQVSYLVFDEADRMLDMGFEPQIRRILEYLPAERQTMFFTATWPMEVRRLASEFLRDPAIIYVGSGELRANKDIDQRVYVIEDMRSKEHQLQNIIREEPPGSRILIFCSTKKMCDQLERTFQMHLRIRAQAIHGDKDQRQRTWALNGFKSGECPILIATDVAARGLDIDDVKIVVNFDFPGNTEDYIHRIGRTGRAGKKGKAFTFIGRKDSRKAGELVKIMEDAGCPVGDDLRSLAGGSRGFSGSSMQFSSGGGRGGYGGGGGGGYGGGYGGGGADRAANGHDYARSDSGPTPIAESEIHRMLADRMQAKLSRDFDTADRIRETLRGRGIDVYDKEKTWSVAPGAAPASNGHDDRDRGRERRDDRDYDRRDRSRSPVRDRRRSPSPRRRSRSPR